MKAKYAAAIRHGISMARLEESYGESLDVHFTSLTRLAFRAYMHTIYTLNRREVEHEQYKDPFNYNTINSKLLALVEAQNQARENAK